MKQLVLVAVVLWSTACQKEIERIELPSQVGENPQTEKLNQELLGGSVSRLRDARSLSQIYSRVFPNRIIAQLHALWGTNLVPEQYVFHWRIP